MTVARRTQIALHRARYASMIPFATPRLFARLFESAFYRRAHEAWLDTLAPAFGAKVVEVGCGPGSFAAMMAARGLLVHGIDRSPAMIERAREHVGHPKARPRFSVGDAEALPLQPGWADLTVASSLLNVVADPKRVMLEMARITRPGGTLAVLLPGPGLLPRAAAAFGERQALEPADAALLELWARSARGVSNERARGWFEDLGLRDVTQHDLLDGMLHTTAGRTAQSLP
jgi:ubiquinone/menaquinone biosynthesis C-methylase UbiE